MSFYVLYKRTVLICFLVSAHCSETCMLGFCDRHATWYLSGQDRTVVCTQVLLRSGALVMSVSRAATNATMQAEDTRQLKALLEACLADCSANCTEISNVLAEISRSLKSASPNTKVWCHQYQQHWHVHGLFNRGRVHGRMQGPRSLNHVAACTANAWPLLHMLDHSPGHEAQPAPSSTARCSCRSLRARAWR